LLTLVTPIFIKKTRRKKRGPGRPSTGERDPTFSFRLAPEIVAKVDAWAKRQLINRSEAFRRLVELALEKRGKQ
jgi:Ribbon-helix-helix protein, copG family